MAVFHFIEGLYNPTRRHASLGTFRRPNSKRRRGSWRT